MNRILSLVASSVCPICGVDTPHEHDGATVKDYQDEQLHFGQLQIEKYQKIVAKREALDAKFLSELQRQIDVAVARKARYETSCPCCRIAKVGDEFIKDTIGTLVVYDYGWQEDVSGDRVYCPECGSCLWDRS